MDLDVSTQTEVSVEVPEGTYTASQNGAGLDVHNYRSATVLIDVGSYSDGTHTFEVQESDDNSTWTAVDDDRITGTEPVVDAAGDANTEHMLGVLSQGQYLRVSVTASGTTTGATYGAYIIAANPRA